MSITGVPLFAKKWDEFDFYDWKFYRTSNRGASVNFDAENGRPVMCVYMEKFSCRQVRSWLF